MEQQEGRQMQRIALGKSLDRGGRPPGRAAPIGQHASLTSAPLHGLGHTLGAAVHAAAP